MKAQVYDRDYCSIGSRFSYFFSFHKQSLFMMTFLAKQTNHFFLSVCLCTAFSSSDEKTPNTGWTVTRHRCNTNKIDCTCNMLRRYSCRDPECLRAGICVCVCVCAYLWFKSFPVHLNDDVIVGIGV